MNESSIFSSSYNGPYMGSVHDGIVASTEIDMTPPTFSRTNSLKKSHVHWPDRSTIPVPMKIDESYSVHQQSVDPHFNLPTSPSSALSHVIQTAIMPAGSTIDSVGANEFTIPCKSSTSISAGYNSIV